jgi:hypothetical protein
MAAGYGVSRDEVDAMWISRIQFERRRESQRLARRSNLPGPHPPPGDARILTSRASRALDRGRIGSTIVHDRSIPRRTSPVALPAGDDPHALEHQRNVAIASSGFLPIAGTRQSAAG